jgi:hypothetical protein
VATCPFFLLQTMAQHREARKPTKEEFEDNMAIIVSRAKAAMHLMNMPAFFSYDNDRIQKYANLGRMGLTEGERVPLPTYSPDMHKPIEHTFQRLERNLWASIYSRGGVNSGITLQQRAGELFWALPAEHIRRDIDSLPFLYKLISTPAGTQFMGADGHYHTGVGGDWAPRAYR